MLPANIGWTFPMLGGAAMVNNLHGLQCVPRGSCAAAQPCPIPLRSPLHPVVHQDHRRVCEVGQRLEGASYAVPACMQKNFQVCSFAGLLKVLSKLPKRRFNQTSTGPHKRPPCQHRASQAMAHCQQPPQPQLPPKSTASWCGCTQCKAHQLQSTTSTAPSPAAPAVHQHGIIMRLAKGVDHIRVTPLLLQGHTRARHAKLFRGACTAERGRGVECSSSTGRVRVKRHGWRHSSTGGSSSSRGMRRRNMAAPYAQGGTSRHSTAQCSAAQRSAAQRSAPVSTQV